MTPFRYLIYALSCAVVGCTADTSSSPSTSTRLLEAGWSFGFCLGPCRAELELSGAELRYRVTSRTEDEIFADNRGELSTEGRSTLDTLVANLPAELMDRYGCPDCADGGASFMVLSRPEATERIEYEFNRPPSELAELDGFLRSVMDALGECRETSVVDVESSCTPLPQR